MDAYDWRRTRVTLLPYDGHVAHRYNELMTDKRGETWGHNGLEAKIGNRVLDVKLTPSGIVILSEEWP